MMTFLIAFVTFCIGHYMGAANAEQIIYDCCCQGKEGCCCEFGPTLCICEQETPTDGR